MTFMTKFWALIALVVVLAFGGNVPNAFAKSPAEVRACVDQSFASAPFTGTLAQKEIQATRLAPRTTVTVEGLMIKLPQGSSIWQQCEGISALVPSTTTTRVADLEAANGALKREVRRLEGLAYEGIATRDRAGFVSDGNTWKDRAAAWKGELDTAKTDAKSAGNLAWLFGIIGAVAIGFAIWLTTLVRKSGAALAQANFKLKTLQTKPSGGDTATDTGLDIPPAPGAKQTGDSDLPPFLDRLAK
jgi:hypothetical protein